MTETPKSAARLMAEIRHLLGLSPAADIPAAIRPEHLAALMAGCRRTDNRAKFDGEARLIAEGIRGNLLITSEQSKTITPEPRKIGIVEKWEHAHYGRDPEMLYQPADETVKWLEISRQQCAAWLASIGETAETLSAHVKAWMGPEWKEAQGGDDAKESALRAIIAEMQRLDPDIPRGEKPSLPGTLLGFHGLCIGKNRALFSRATSTFDEYRKGLCTFEQKGPPCPADLEYYQDMATQMGVKWERPTESKPRA